MPDSGALTHPLDHPIWTALATRQQALAEGGALARRYPPAIAPFAAMPDMSPQSFAALVALMLKSDMAVLFTPDPVTAPAEFKVLLDETGEQMIGTLAETSIRGVEIVKLGADDVPESCLVRFPARSWRGESFRSCTYSPATPRPSRCTGGKGCKSAVVFT